MSIKSLKPKKFKKRGLFDMLMNQSSNFPRASLPSTSSRVNPGRLPIIGLGGVLNENTR